MKQQIYKISQNIKNNFWRYTINFIFIIAYVNIFQMIFGPENSIVGVIFTIMMSASMVRDLTAAPLRHFLIQSFVLVSMALGAFLVTNLSPLPAFFINLFVIFLILYAFTYEYSNHIYFPYILSYLFLVFISPVGTEGLPKRLLAMAAGAVSIILYQLFMGRKRVVTTARDVLSDIIADAKNAISCALDGSKESADLADIRHKVCILSRTVYDRRSKILCVSDAGFAMIDAGRGLEHLIILIHELNPAISAEDKILLNNVSSQLDLYHSFLQQSIAELPPFERSCSISEGSKKTSELFYNALDYIRDRLLHMSDPQKRTHYQRTVLSVKVRLQMALDISQVRVLYALRTSLLLACATLLVQLLALPHGKWLLFTLASVSLPYTNDVPAKIKKRTLATAIGGLASVVLYAVIPTALGRTAVMMLSGYLSFYFSDYVSTFACSTVGALGGAVFLGAFGFRDVGSMFFIRLCYVLAGVCIGFAVNCLISPYKREQATQHLWEKYQLTVRLLSRLCHEKKVDAQLYYNLVIRAHLQEEKLSQNAAAEGWNHFPQLLSECREMVRRAHRSHAEDAMESPKFDARHLHSAKSAI